MVSATRYQQRRLVGEDETTDASQACPICGDGALRHAVAVLQDAPRVPLLACSRCGACSAGSMPTPDVLADYYAHYYGGDAEHSVTLHDVDAFSGHVMRDMPGLGVGGSVVRILDYGGGDGALSLAIAQKLRRAVEVTLVDYKRASAPGIPGVTVAWTPDLEGAHGVYDLVLASAVLEHIPDLRPVLARLLGLIAEGGYAYARTPFMLPFARVLPSFDFTYPGHVHDMGPAFWNAITETFDAGLEVVASRPSRVETGLMQSPLRTLAAHCLKLPARIEIALRGRPRRLVWPFVGGWEVVLRRRQRLGVTRSGTGGGQ